MLNIIRYDCNVKWVLIQCMQLIFSNPITIKIMTDIHCTCTMLRMVIGGVRTFLLVKLVLKLKTVGPLNHWLTMSYIKTLTPAAILLTMMFRNIKMIL